MFSHLFWFIFSKWLIRFWSIMKHVVCNLTTHQQLNKKKTKNQEKKEGGHPL